MARKPILICPAILTTDGKELLRHLKRFVDFGFTAIDIDIQETPFASNPTLTFVEAFKVLKDFEAPPWLSLGWDLKLAEPEKAVENLLAESGRWRGGCRVYIYNRANIDFVTPKLLKENHIGLGILGTEPVEALDTYALYPEVQFMTITVERQGAALDPGCLAKVGELRNVGYGGQISIDGGVNGSTAKLISASPLDRVCVGSYFQKADDLTEVYSVLERDLPGRK